MKTRAASYGMYHNLRTTLFALALGGALSVAGSLASAASYTVNPANGATGVSRSAPVVFTFSEAMNTNSDATSFNFITLGGIPQFLQSTVVWDPAGTNATVSPISLWPGTTTIQWILIGETAEGSDTFEEFGTFTTGSSSAGGTGTNAVSSFSVGVYHSYSQTNSVAPVLDPDLSYFFRAGTVLASNRTATAVTVQPPALSAISLSRSPTAPEIFFFFDFTNDLARFNAKYPPGAYQFAVTAAASNQQISVTLSNPSQQPNTPRITDYDAAQAVNAAQPFTLTWEAFSGGTANDFILVEVGSDFRTPETPAQGGLNGTATSVTIPAGKLRANTNYTATIYFARLTTSSNGTASVTSSERVTTTEFSLRTTGTNSAAPSLTNSAAISGGQFRFQVNASAGQTFYVESSTTLVSNSWTTVYTTNPPGSLTTISLPMNPSGRQFFRVRTN